MNVRSIRPPVLSVLAALVLAGPVRAAPPAAVMIEAERFHEPGGWTIDAQFRQQMGSTYLLAAGTGEPVADAVTRVALPAAGAWRLWVRCRDWDPTSPGRFQVLLNDKPSATTFGEQKKGWAWVDGGSFDLPAGDVKIRLHDLTGYYGRCDALILAVDPAFHPPDDPAALAALRETLTGPYPVSTQRFDFVVVGGGYGGVGAAVQAARLGVKTALIQNRPVLGGNASKEIRVGPGGASPHVLRYRETGLSEEIAEGFPRPEGGDWSAAIDLVVKDVPNLAVFLDTEGTRAVMKDRRVVAVDAEDVVTGKRYRFEAPLFADCTGDGTIAFSAGCEFRHGEEAQSEYGEARAPATATTNTMGTSIVHHSVRMATPQPYTPPAFARKFTAEDFTKRKQNLAQGTWWIEYGGMRDTIADAEEIRDELLRVIFGAFDWAKNHDPEFREANANYKLSPVPTVGGKRESRRFFGDYVLKQQDVEAGTIFPDAVAYGGWPIDIHPSPGIYGKDIPPAIFTRLEKPYTIPYRCLYARDAENLFLAGRHSSVSHVALGSTRLIQTIGLMGQAVGAAARLCLDHGRDPRGLNPDYIRDLQQELVKWDVWLPGVADESADNLCRGAKATASSSQPADWVDIKVSDSGDAKPAPMTMARAQTVAVASAGVDRVHLRLAAKGDAPVEAALQIGPEGGAPVVVKAMVKPGDFRWVAFKLPEPLVPNRPYFVMLPKTPGVEWSYNDRGGGKRLYGTPGKWTTSGGSYVMKPVGTPIPVGEAGPACVIDGWAVPGPEGHRQWRSDPARGLPQWIEVDFGKPTRLNTVHVIFDTNIYGRFPSGKPAGEITAEDYRILWNDGGAWKAACEEKGNWRRFRRHNFPAVTTDRIRLEILKAANGDQARVFEIRAYLEAERH